jgi:hypothetical protein
MVEKPAIGHYPLCFFTRYGEKRALRAKLPCICAPLFTAHVNALREAQEIVRGFTEPDTGGKICADYPDCDLCVTGPLIVAALGDAMKWRKA